MTEKELKRLSRMDLLQILVKQGKMLDAVKAENEELKKENERLQRELGDKTLRINEAGSLADASLILSRVFEAAQEAADIYLDNIKRRERELMGTDSKNADRICDEE